jgi:membrane protein implicated in regulation of membrane protease activity
VTGLDIEPHWLWLLAAVLLGIAEVIAPGVFLIWLAAAAALTGLVTMLLGIELAFQLVLFTLLAIFALYAGRRWYLSNPVTSSDPLLNDRGARLTGETLTVVSAIENGRGRVRVGDGVWPCKGPDAPEGALVRVTGADGACLRVEPLDAPALPAAEPR